MDAIVFEKQKAEKWLKKHLPLNAPKWHEQLFYDNFKALDSIGISMAMGLDDDMVYEQIEHKVLNDEDLGVYELLSLTAKYLNENCNDFFDFPNIVKFMDLRHGEQTITAFEKTGRNIVTEIMREYKKNPDKDSLYLLAKNGLKVCNTLYSEGYDTDEVKLFNVLSPLGVDDSCIYAKDGMTIDDLPNEVIYRSWKKAHNQKLPVEGLIEELMLDREPDTEVCQEIMEFYTELNNDLVL